MYRLVAAVVVILSALPEGLSGQAETRHVRTILEEEIVPAPVLVFQLRDYVLKRIARPPAPANAEQWTAEASRLRQKALEHAFHGWPKSWIESPPRFEDAGVIQGKGYRIRKLRYEIVPGFQSTALLYEPEKLTGKVPAILNVNGHVGQPGKAVEYKQKRCITFARSGVMALSLEWLSCGELAHTENDHFYAGHLDLAGVHELGLFYLAMRRGLDYLDGHPNTDRERIGMTGLSGGGWQTIMLSALDPRIRASNPVAGFSSISSRVEVNRYGDIGDPEQSPVDVFESMEYPHLAAMLAPRPLHLSYNAEDDCCFRAPVVRPLIYDAVRPVFNLYGKEDFLSWHENRDPGTHNYHLDNRLSAYRFFSRHFGLRIVEDEALVASEVRPYEELTVGLPHGNHTILSLARSLAREVKRGPAPASAAEKMAERAKLAGVVHYQPVELERVWTTGISKRLGVESRSQLFSMKDGLSAAGVLLKSIGSAPAQVTIVLDDEGMAASVASVADVVNRGEQVLALDLAFIGPAWGRKSSGWAYQQMLYAVGARPLGIEASQLITIARWAARQTGTRQVRVKTTGIRTQVIAAVAAALRPELFSELLASEGVQTMEYIFRKPVEYADAPDLFCLDLFKVTDIDRLWKLGEPVVARLVSRIDQ